MERLNRGPYEGHTKKFILKLVDEHHESIYMALISVVLIVIFLIYAKLVNIKLQKKDKLNQLLLDRIKKIAYKDALTGIPNRLSFLEELKKLLALAKRNQLNIAFMFIDLDGFKNINDSLGHKVGDRVLRDVAKNLKSNFREEDIYGRMGGDEFVVAMAGINEKKDLKKICDKLLFNINNIPLDSDIKNDFGASIGVIYGKCFKELDINFLINQADRLMYQVKKMVKITT